MAEALGLLLADTSAWHHSADPRIAPLWDSHLSAARIATTEPVQLEVLYSARSPAEYDDLVEALGALHALPCTWEAIRRAMEVQRTLAHQRPLHHRIAIPDLLIAAVAELSGATVWHYDGDYDRIADVTGQSVEWIAARGRL